MSWTSVSPGVYPHEWFDICASADRHGTRYAGDAPRCRKRLTRVSEWLTFRAQQMTAAPVIETNRVNIHFASPFISQYEALRDATFDLRKSVGRQYFPHPGLMGVPHDEVEVFVFACLLANKGVDTPAAVQPHIGSRRAEPP
jgi:hypothetical protein